MVMIHYIRYNYVVREPLARVITQALLLTLNKLPTYLQSLRNYFMVFLSLFKGQIKLQLVG